MPTSGRDWLRPAQSTRVSGHPSPISLRAASSIQRASASSSLTGSNPGQRARAASTMSSFDPRREPSATRFTVDEWVLWCSSPYAAHHDMMCVAQPTAYSVAAPPRWWVSLQMKYSQGEYAKSPGAPVPTQDDIEKSDSYKEVKDGAVMDVVENHCGVDYSALITAITVELVSLEGVVKGPFRVWYTWKARVTIWYHCVDIKSGAVIDLIGFGNTFLIVTSRRINARDENVTVGCHRVQPG